MHAHKIPMYRNETPHVRWLTTAQSSSSRTSNTSSFHGHANTHTSIHAHKHTCTKSKTIKINLKYPKEKQFISGNGYIQGKKKKQNKTFLSYFFVSIFPIKVIGNFQNPNERKEAQILTVRFLMKRKTFCVCWGPLMMSGKQAAS